MKSSRSNESLLLSHTENHDTANPTTSALGNSAARDDNPISPVNPYKKLQSAKRVDWRFFLPNPELHQVAYWGPLGGGLKEALTSIAQEVVSLPIRTGYGARGNTATAKYPLIVLKDPTTEIIQRAIASLEQNGTLYIETESVLWPQRWFKRNFVHQVKKRALLSHPNDYRKLLQHQGLTDVQILWMWPGFRKTRKIIPLDTPGIFTYLFDAELQGTKPYQWLLNLLYRELMVKRQWFEWLIPSFGIIASARSGTALE